MAGFARHDDEIVCLAPADSLDFRPSPYDPASVADSLHR